MNTASLYNHNPLRKSPTTWRSTYDFEYSLKSLSGSMKKALRGALKNNNLCDYGQRTINSLVRRCLCNGKGDLSFEGKVVAVALSSLKKQAETLSLPITEIELAYEKRPELSVRNYLLNDRGYKQVCFAEGGDILILLYCMCFDEIWKTWKLHPYFESDGESNSISYMYTCPLSCGELLEIKPNLYEYLIDSIAAAKRSDIEKSFQKLRQWHADMGWSGDKWPWQSYVGLRLPFLISLHEALGNETLVGIAQTYFIDPGAFRKGWPDITAIDSKKNVKLFEIKTSDKFHPSQIITLIAMDPFIRSEVIKVERKIN